MLGGCSSKRSQLEKQMSQRNEAVGWGLMGSGLLLAGPSLVVFALALGDQVDSARHQDWLAPALLAMVVGTLLALSGFLTAVARPRNGEASKKVSFSREPKGSALTSRSPSARG
jgi:hypothetical protein